ncbi:HNH endonuclease [Streptomyces lividans]
MYIDHINQNRSDNRIENLRLVSNKENSNNRSLSSRNKSGINGVSWCKRENRWLVQAREFDKTVFICYKDTIEEAALARSQYDKLNGYHENHGSENKGYLNTRA